MPFLPSVAIVILNWNGRKFLSQFLPSVLASTYDNYRVIVADNGSSDDSVVFLQTNYPNVQVLKNSINDGFAKGYNTALKQITADYYVLLNSDVEVTPGWIEPIIKLMVGDNTIAACQPKILSYTNKKQFEYAGASGGWIDKYAYPFSRGRVFDVCEIDNGQYDDVQQIFWGSGAAFFVRAPVFHECGGFDEYFFAHQEEIDLCWRMQLAGYKIFVQPSSVVYHVGGGTLPMGDKRKVFLNFRNNLIMLTKNTPGRIAAWKIPVRILLDNAASAKAFFTGKFSTVFAIEKAHFHYLGWLFFHKHRSMFPVRRSCNLPGVYNGFVILQYFIRKKRRFSEIIKNND